MSNNPPPLLISETKTGSRQARLKFPTKKWLGDKQSGITLVEVLVSLFLFGVALGSLMYLLTTILTSADDLRNNTIAAGLAQEGLEVVRAMRDQDWIPVPPNTFGFSIQNGDWEVQWDSDALDRPYSSSDYLKKDATGLYSYNSGGSGTQFSREIRVSTVTVPTDTSAFEKIVTVSVFWLSSNGTTRSLQAESHLFSWR